MSDKLISYEVIRIINEIDPVKKRLVQLNNNLVNFDTMAFLELDTIINNLQQFQQKIIKKMEKIAK
jgi:hypothetical protein